ncbi:hypothetical protein [Microtetraspora glauca]|uniref:DUF2190 family protein n=1 Tax=Microtetraspora glauca TaxID=1996 RepID=A0ABV3GAP0_MICGL
MALRIPTAARNAAANGVAALANGGSIEIYTGSQPANADAAASGTLLATVPLAGTAFGAASSGVATLAGTPLSATGAAAGTAGWFRVKGSGGATVMDGAIGAELTLNTTTISVGVTVQITGGTITMPAG